MWWKMGMCVYVAVCFEGHHTLTHNIHTHTHTHIDLGSAYGTAKSGVGISSMGVMNPGLVMRNVIPVVMAGECVCVCGF